MVKRGKGGLSCLKSSQSFEVTLCVANPVEGNYPTRFSVPDQENLCRRNGTSRREGLSV
jgi:hypothetical protein